MRALCVSLLCAVLEAPWRPSLRCVSRHLPWQARRAPRPPSSSRRRPLRRTAQWPRSRRRLLPRRLQIAWPKPAGKRADKHAPAVYVFKSRTSTPLRSYRRRSMYEARRSLRILASRTLDKLHSGCSSFRVRQHRIPGFLVVPQRSVQLLYVLTASSCDEKGWSVTRTRHPPVQLLLPRKFNGVVCSKRMVRGPGELTA